MSNENSEEDCHTIYYRVGGELKGLKIPVAVPQGALRALVEHRETDPKVAAAEAAATGKPSPDTEPPPSTTNIHPDNEFYTSMNESDGSNDGADGD